MSDRLLTTHQASERVGLARATLAKLRITGGGPRFRKIGARVMYPEQELDKWLDSKPLLRSTSDRRAEG